MCLVMIEKSSNRMAQQLKRRKSAGEFKAITRDTLDEQGTCEYLKIYLKPKTSTFRK